MKKRVTFTLDKDTIEELREVSNRTMIPQARLVEESIKKVIAKYKEPC